MAKSMDVPIHVKLKGFQDVTPGGPHRSRPFYLRNSHHFQQNTSFLQELTKNIQRQC